MQGGSARLPVVLFIGFDGVRVQVKNAPQVHNCLGASDRRPTDAWCPTTRRTVQVGAHWEYPAIKGWESSKSHFGFRSEDAYRREERFKFDTHEVRANFLRLPYAIDSHAFQLVECLIGASRRLG
eukprot:SAG25_NODE_659_length_6098_cov_41.853476_3_plen_125_part_00